MVAARHKVVVGGGCEIATTKFTKIQVNFKIPVNYKLYIGIKHTHSNK